MITNNKYQLWLTFNGEKEKLRFPVLPKKFKISSGSKDQSVDIVGLGEILVAQNRPVTEFSFSSFFPATKFPGMAVEELTPPKQLSNKITEWKNSTSPVHLIVTGLGIDVYCRISKFTQEEEGGDVGTINYDISFKEYREPKIRQVTLESETQTATVEQDTARTDNTTQPKTYTVQPGDCLFHIALNIFGDGARYNEIYNLNKQIIKSPHLIYAGQVLRLP